MSIARVLTIVALIAPAVSCDSPAEPSERVYLALSQFETPAEVSIGDTVRVAFQYLAWCGPTPAMDLNLRSALVGVSIWTTRSVLDSPCPGIYPIPVRVEFLLLPQYLGVTQTRVTFRQASGVDSVRTITTFQPSLHAP